MALMIALCALTSLFCAIALLRSFSIKRVGKLFWIALCFVGFAFENILLFLDLILLPNISLGPLRYGVALAGVVCLSFSFFDKAPEQ